MLSAALGLAALSATAVFRSDAWVADLVESFRPHLRVAAIVCLPLGFSVRGS